VEVETDPVDGVDKVYMEAPKGGTGWKVVELRPVSEGTSIANVLQQLVSLTPVKSSPIPHLRNPKVPPNHSMNQRKKTSP
jgi:hypothetical protein